MATLTQTLPVLLASSQERTEPSSVPLKTAVLPKSSTLGVDVHKVALDWVDSFNKIIASAPISLSSLATLFAETSYWRDLLCLSWDLHTLRGIDAIRPLVQNCRVKSLAIDSSDSKRAPQPTSLGADGETNIIQSFLKVETDVGSGNGVVRLVNERGRWVAYTLFTSLEELRGFEEPLGDRRPNGVAHGSRRGRQNWLDRRKIEEKCEGEEPTVLIVGAGQAGLMVGARLKMLGIKALIIDRNDRIGDNWRSRYHQLVLHDAVHVDHMPYLNFPAHWPVYTPKDKLADWFETYAKALELNVWLQTSLKTSSWDDETGQWTVGLERHSSSENRILHPKHIIQATGHSGEANFPFHLPGLSSFAGDRLCHSSRFQGAKPNSAGKKAIVVGCCNSGHDIAQDFYENGYDVTMVQRSTTYVVSAEANMKTIAIYTDLGLSVDDADTLFQSIPNEVMKRVAVDVTVVTQKTDEALLQGLANAGFALDKGPGDAGLWIKYLQRGGGYYIDVGCSQLIADGKIKIKQGVEIAEVLPNGLRFKDDSVLEADEIVFATGYQNMRSQCRNIFGDEVADRVGDVWGFDSEGEIRTLYRKTGHPGFWFMAGNFLLCRYFSKRLALQIKALEEGLCEYKE